MHDEAQKPIGAPPETEANAPAGSGAEEELRPLTITLGEQVFRIRVGPRDEVRYRRAAQQADTVLKDILEGGVVGGARALAMTAFELAAELEDARAQLRQSREDRARVDEDRARVDRLIHRLEGVLERAAAETGKG